MWRPNLNAPPSRRCCELDLQQAVRAALEAAEVRDSDSWQPVLNRLALDAALALDPVMLAEECPSALDPVEFVQVGGGR